MAFLKRFLLALTFLAFQCSTWCQGDAFCGAEESHVLLMGLNPAYSGGFASLNDHLAATAGMPRNNLDVYTIPVVVHVIHRGSQLGVDENITDAQILSAIEGLNNDFRKRPGTLGDGEGVDTFIEFKLAQRTPVGEPTNGILRVNGSVIPGYSEHGISNGLDSNAGDQTAVKGLTTWFGEDYINIFVVPEINGNDGGNGIQGFAYLGPTNDARDGIVVLYNAFGLEGELKPGRTLNKTITHEMGHHLSLYHTFSNTSTCTSETNCETQGDLVCDTPATLANDSDCESPDCAGALVENYMDYTLETCKNMFTAGQRDRMRGSLESARSSLLESLGGMPVTERDLTVAGLANVGESTCIPSLAPAVVVTNFGTETVTGFELTTSVNGLTPFTTVHQESVASGASVQAMLPELALAAGTNELSLEVRLLGNGQDDFAGNDQSVQTILLEPGDYWTMTLNTDTWGNEISWRIEDSEGEAIMNGGNYPINAATYVSSGCVPLGCHTLIMEDSNGDGLCSIDFGDDGICDIGGSMSLTNAAGDVLVELDNTNNNYGSQGSWEVCASEVTEMEGCTDENSNGICDDAEVLGCPDVNACNFTPGAIFDDGSCSFAEQYYDCNGQCHCDEDGDGVCCELETDGCTDSDACNYVANASEDDGSCEYAETHYNCAGICLNDSDGDGICNELEVAGCEDVAACNFDATATDSDGSCEYAETHYNCDGNCLNDSDGDGICDEFESTITSVQSGSWHEPATWDCHCVPEHVNDVVVQHQVVLLADATFSSISVAASGDLLAVGDVTLVFDGHLLASEGVHLPSIKLQPQGSSTIQQVVGNWEVNEVHVSNASTLIVHDFMEVHGHIQIDAASLMVGENAELLLSENEFGRATVLRSGGGSLEGPVTRQIILPATPNRNMAFVEQRIAIGLEGVKVSELVGDIPTWGFVGADDPDGFANIGYWSADADFNYAIIQSTEDVLPVWEGVYLALAPAESYTLQFTGTMPSSDLTLDIPGEAFTALLGNATNANLDLNVISEQLGANEVGLDCWNINTLQFDHYVNGLNTNGLNGTLQPNTTCQYLPSGTNTLTLPITGHLPNGTEANPTTVLDGKIVFSAENESGYSDEAVIAIREGASVSFLASEDAINTSSLFSACDLYVVDESNERMGISQISFENTDSVFFELMLGANRPLDGHYTVQVQALDWPCGEVSFRLSGYEEFIPLVEEEILTAIELSPNANHNISIGTLRLTSTSETNPCAELDIPGCLDPSAFNFDEDATVEDGSCIFVDDDCEVSPSLLLAFENHMAVFPLQPTALTLGVDTAVNLAIWLPNLVSEPEAGSLYNAISFDVNDVSGLPSGLTLSTLPQTILAGDPLCQTLSGTPEQEGEFDVAFMGTLTVSLFGQHLSFEGVTVNHPVSVEPNPNPIWGCTYAFASNYLSFASMDDGSCIIAGCTDPEACNHQALAELDDESCDYSCRGCTYETALNFDSGVTRDDGSCVFEWAESTCPADLDNDGLVGSADLLSVLGQFGLSCESP